MPRYQRAYVPGGTFFFTVVIADRRDDLLVREIDRLRGVYRSVAERYPFETLAICILPDHLHIGLSVGVATCPFDASDYSTLVKLADQAMYLAKREGGGRVRTANDLRLFWEELPHSA